MSRRRDITDISYFADERGARCHRVTRRILPEPVSTDVSTAPLLHYRDAHEGTQYSQTRFENAALSLMQMIQGQMACPTLVAKELPDDKVAERCRWGCRNDIDEITPRRRCAHLMPRQAAPEFPIAAAMIAWLLHDAMTSAKDICLSSERTIDIC